MSNEWSLELKKNTSADLSTKSGISIVPHYLLSISLMIDPFNWIVTRKAALHSLKEFIERQLLLLPTTVGQAKASCEQYKRKMILCFEKIIPEAT